MNLGRTSWFCFSGILAVQGLGRLVFEFMLGSEKREKPQEADRPAYSVPPSLPPPSTEPGDAHSLQRLHLHFLPGSLDGPTPAWSTARGLRCQWPTEAARHSPQQGKRLVRRLPETQ